MHVILRSQGDVHTGPTQPFHFLPASRNNTSTGFNLHIETLYVQKLNQSTVYSARKVFMFIFGKCVLQCFYLVKSVQQLDIQCLVAPKYWLNGKEGSNLFLNSLEAYHLKMSHADLDSPARRCERSVGLRCVWHVLVCVLKHLFP